MKKFSLAPIALAILLTGCSASNTDKLPMIADNSEMIQAAQLAADNPFASSWDTPHNIPDFAKIDNAHYMPAFKAAIAAQQLEISAITRNPESATFANTIEAFEYSGNLLDNVSSVFYNLTSAETNDELKALAKKVSPMLSAHSDDLSLNADLFNRVADVYRLKNSLDLTIPQQKLLQDTYIGFVRSGAKLNSSEKGQIRKLNAQLSELTLRFGDNLLAETNSFEVIISKNSDLSGLSQSVIDAAADTAKSRGHAGKWVFTTHRPSITPFITFANNRELRKKLYLGYTNRANNDNEFDNKETLAKIASLRVTKAQLMAYKSHAHFVLEETRSQNTGRGL